MRRFYQRIWDTDPINRDATVKHLVALNNSLAQLATKLRLAITSVDRRAGILTEKGDPLKTDGNVIKAGVLFGGPGKTKY
jgi:hypothetical protein